MYSRQVYAFKRVIFFILTLQEQCIFHEKLIFKVMGKFPVMVWIHGGAHVKGGANDFHYKVCKCDSGLCYNDSSKLCQGAVRNLVSNGVVVVTIQYRLGPFGRLLKRENKQTVGSGFFTTFTPDFPANLGLFDQILALRWIKEEIGAFGGDPEQ